MKRILIVLLTFGLFQGVCVFAEDDGFSHKHGRSKDDSGISNPSPGVGEKIGNLGGSERKQQPAEKQKVQKQFKENAGQRQLKPQKQFNLSGNAKRSNGSPNWQG